MIEIFLDRRLRALGPHASLRQISPRAAQVACCDPETMAAEPTLYADAPHEAVVVARREAWLTLHRARAARQDRRRALAAGPGDAA